MMRGRLEHVASASRLFSPWPPPLPTPSMMPSEYASPRCPSRRKRSARCCARKREPMPKVIITARYFAVDPEPLEVLQAHGCTLVHTDLDWTLGDGNVSEAQAVELLQDVDGAIISSLPLTDAVLAHVPSLRVIAVRGVGYDSVDVEAATRRHLPVLVAPGFTESVADYTFGLMLA